MYYASNFGRYTIMYGILPSDALLILQQEQKEKKKGYL